MKSFLSIYLMLPAITFRKKNFSQLREAWSLYSGFAPREWRMAGSQEPEHTVFLKEGNERKQKNLSSIFLYQKHISPLYHFLGRSLFGNSFACRYTPTCSEYMKLAIAKHGTLKGLFLGIKRFLKCNPLFLGGHDPIPD